MPAPTALAVQSISEAGLIPVTEVAGDNTNGNSLSNNGLCWVEATNGGGSTATLAVAFANKVHGQTIPSKSYSIPAAGKLRAGPFDPAAYGSTVVLTPSAATVTLAAYQLSSA